MGQSCAVFMEYTPFHYSVLLRSEGVEHSVLLRSDGVDVERSRFIKERNNYSTTLLHGVEYIGYTLLLEYVWNGICATPEWTQDWLKYKVLPPLGNRLVAIINYLKLFISFLRTLEQIHQKTSIIWVLYSKKWELGSRAGQYWVFGGSISISIYIDASWKNPEYPGLTNFGKARQIKFWFLENHPLE